MDSSVLKHLPLPTPIIHSLIVQAFACISRHRQEPSKALGHCDRVANVVTPGQIAGKKTHRQWFILSDQMDLAQKIFIHGLREKELQCRQLSQHFHLTPDCFTGSSGIHLIDYSLGGSLPATSHRCHHKPKCCPPNQQHGGFLVSPLLFHPNAKGSQITMDLSLKTVKRQASFCNAITFSNRPVVLYEQVRLKITKKQCCWSGALRLGFTAKDPSRINPDTLPKYACPDLVSQSGFWAKALPEEFANEGNVIAFWVDKKGRVFYRVDDSSPMLFFSGVLTSDPLWALIDVYGLTRGVQLLVTSCDPSVLRPSDLPYNPESLVDRKEFWAVCRVPTPLQSGDILGFLVNQEGELLLSHNGMNAGMQVCVDNSRPLWMFFGLHGALAQLRILGKFGFFVCLSFLLSLDHTGKRFKHDL
ncbi:UNVERIFIED_CONTAM: hypothetical protein FKN15_066172 [Acipenser sinensis]